MLKLNWFALLDDDGHSYFLVHTVFMLDLIVCMFLLILNTGEINGEGMMFFASGDQYLGE